MRSRVLDSHYSHVDIDPGHSSSLDGLCSSTWAKEYLLGRLCSLEHWYFSP
ncbi:MAG: hypothetical protein VXZ75_00865 [Candidatus Thermoplasmatota archaeon]|nr:hypothetical protein [Candidatus Thermoplasmatota archaeon]